MQGVSLGFCVCLCRLMLVCVGGGGVFGWLRLAVMIMWDCAIWNLVLHNSTQTEEALCSLIAAESVKSAVT